MGQKSVKSKKMFYGAFAVLLVICVSLSLAFSLGLGTFQTQTSDIPQATPTSESTATEVNLTDSNATSSADELQNGTLMTREEALAMAMPLIEQYAAENNRTIEEVTAKYSMMLDLSGSRGGLNMEQVLAMNLTGSEAHKQFSKYPVWCVSAQFDSRFNHGSFENGNPQFWIIGYDVIIWADTKELERAGASGVC